ncbi:adenylate kinase [Deinococcus sp. AJ005]|uniref:adenylate kinase n=1 Tax=Deinococcus sp. AJ005 TaxID=2652443 RepID=UPI00125CB107|nr:adenylate kinase [Deinococcus sp. AJ005]QFP76422.1 adenylate kinase [Deinococcus sp. AJ005]
MQRIIVIGTTGSGKTTLARAIAAKLGLPHGEQDAWNHLADWQEAPLAQFRAAVDFFTAQHGWVMDGNYGKARDIGWSRADTLIWMDYPGQVVFWRVLTRTLQRVIGKQELWNGNRETWRGAVQADAPLRWIFKTHWRRRRETPELAAKYPNLAVIRLRSPCEAQRWFQNLSPEAESAPQPHPE